MVFSMVSDNQKVLSILNLLRTFVSSPKGSEFANELVIVLDYYVQKTLTPAKENKTMVVYDKNLYNTLIKYSCLAQELVKLFIEVPNRAFLKSGDINTDFDFTLETSCLFPPEEEDANETDQGPKGTFIANRGYESQQEIRRYQSLFKLKVNSENLPMLLAELLKSCKMPTHAAWGK